MEFHEFAEDYPLMPDLELGVIVDDMKLNGFDKRFPITTYQDKILDGRNRFKASEIAEAEPVFQEFEGTDEEAKAFVILANENRRHLAEDDLKKRREARIKRVVSYRMAGQSTRTIAGKEKISEMQVRRDIEDGAATGVAVDPGEIIGKDGKKRKTKPPLSDEEKAKKALAKAEKDAAKAADKLAKARDKAERNGKADDSDANENVVMDSLKKMVPEDLRKVFIHVPEFQSIMRDLSLCRGRINKLRDHQAGAWIDHQETDRMLKQVFSHLKFAMPYTECPKCKRKPKRECQGCKGTGWINKSMHRSSSSDPDKVWLEERT